MTREARIFAGPFVVRAGSGYGRAYWRVEDGGRGYVIGRFNTAKAADEIADALNRAYAEEPAS